MLPTTGMKSFNYAAPLDFQTQSDWMDQIWIGVLQGCAVKKYCIYPLIATPSPHCCCRRTCSCSCKFTAVSRWNIFSLEKKPSNNERCFRQVIYSGSKHYLRTSQKKYSGSGCASHWLHLLCYDAWHLPWCAQAHEDYCLVRIHQDQDCPTFCLTGSTHSGSHLLTAGSFVLPGVHGVQSASCFSQ